MPKYKVVGADRKTSQDKTVYVDAGSEQAATVVANNRGIMASHVSVAQQNQPPSRIGVSVVIVIANVVGILCAIAAGILFLASLSVSNEDMAESMFNAILPVLALMTCAAVCLVLGQLAGMAAGIERKLANGG